LTAGVVRWGWVVYAGLLTCAVIVGEMLNLRLGPPSALTLANWLLTIALLVSLWGYALRRPLGTARYWRAVFCIVLFANIVMLIPVLLAGGDMAWFTGALTLLIVPAYYAAFRYAFRTPELWRGIA
jgi:hypothetical protein